MAKDYSLDALNRFLDYTLEKGLLKPETAKSRKTAVSKILEKIPDEQRADVRKINLDLEAEHFANRQGAGYIASSLQAYKSRARSALSDFESYADNPMTFRPSSSRSGKAQSKPSNNSKPARKGTQGTQAFEGGPSDSSGSKNSGGAHQTQKDLTFPVPIRAGLIVQLQGLPFDLTGAEAEKISQVVKALATDK